MHGPMNITFAQFSISAKTVLQWLMLLEIRCEAGCELLLQMPTVTVRADVSDNNI